MVRVTKWRVLVGMIGFVSTLVTHSLLITLKYRQYSAIADLYTFHFTAAHALKFPVFISRLLAAVLNTETSTQITTNITHEVLQSHFKSSQADLLYSSLRQLTTSPRNSWILPWVLLSSLPYNLFSNRVGVTAALISQLPWTASYRDLSWTDNSWRYSRYIASAPTTQKTQPLLLKRVYRTIA
jgi:hypothetical protein